MVLGVTRKSYALALDRGDLRMILRKGAIFIPVVASFWIAQNVDLYALSKFATDSQVGLYRLAGRIASFIHYFSSALFMAWTPLARTLTFRAAEKEHSREVIGGTMLTYFVLGGMLLILGLTVTADGLVRIAPSSYAGAAPLVPLLGGAYLAHGLWWPSTGWLAPVSAPTTSSRRSFRPSSSLGSPSCSSPGWVPRARPCR